MGAEGKEPWLPAGGTHERVGVPAAHFLLTLGHRVKGTLRLSPSLGRNICPCKKMPVLFTASLESRGGPPTKAVCSDSRRAQRGQAGSESV